MLPVYRGRLPVLPERIPSMEKLTFTIRETADVLGISVKSAYDAAARGELPSCRIGRRIVVSRTALDEWLAGQRDVAAVG